MLWHLGLIRKEIRVGIPLELKIWSVSQRPVQPRPRLAGRSAKRRPQAVLDMFLAGPGQDHPAGRLGDARWNFTGQGVMFVASIGGANELRLGRSLARWKALRVLFKSHRNTQIPIRTLTWWKSRIFPVSQNCQKILLGFFSLVLSWLQSSPIWA